MSNPITDGFLASYAEVAPDGRLNVIGGYTTGWNCFPGDEIQLWAVIQTAAEGYTPPVNIDVDITLPSGAVLKYASAMKAAGRYFVVPITLVAARFGDHVIRVSVGAAAIDLPLEVHA